MILEEILKDLKDVQGDTWKFDVACIISKVEYEIKKNARNDSGESKQNEVII